jgi:hypothetical protein
MECFYLHFKWHTCIIYAYEFINVLTLHCLNQSSISRVSVCFSFQVLIFGVDPVRALSPDNATEGYQCTEEGIFPDPEDCHSYYRCTSTLQAKHESCFWGAYYHPVRKGCSIGGCSILTKPSQFGISAANETNVSDGQFRCEYSGRFPDPKDCRGYYNCDSNLRPQHYICFFGIGHYDIENNICTLGIC